MAPKKKKPLPEAVPLALPAQGNGTVKRTPQSHFDPAAGQETYEIEKVVATRKNKNKEGHMIDMFHVKWKGYDSKQNTWEPLANLAGCEEFVASFYEEQKQKNAEAAAEEEVLRLERQEAMAAKRQQEFAAVLAARAARRAGTPSPAAPSPADPAAAAADAAAADAAAPASAPAAAAAAPASEGDAETAEEGNARRKAKRRSAPCWECFSDAGMGEDRVICVLPHTKKPDSVCGEVISTKWGSSGMWNHLLYCHQGDYQRCAACLSALS